MTDSVVHALFGRAEARPQATAFVEAQRRVGYAELLDEARAVAGHLRAGGLGRGERVALLMENSATFAAAYYGVLWAGGVVVALNTAARVRDLANWIGHSEASWLIADAQHRELPGLLEAVGDDLRIVVAGEPRSEAVAARAVGWDRLTADAGLCGEPRVEGGDQWAAMIYTSGTTGTPKGVMLSHRNLLSNTESIVEYLGLTADDCTVCVLPFYYSYGNSLLHTHLYAGASLVLVNSMMYPAKVLERIQDERATGFSGVPSTYGLLLGRTKLSDFDLSSLRYLTQAGGAMPAVAIDRIRQAVPSARFFAMYGQTEATARLTYLPPESLEAKRGSVGIPVPGVEIRVRDSAGRDLGAGEVGEVNARGPNVMLGYWKSEELTREVLVDGWLGTGDLGYLDADGFLFLQGRARDMIKTGAHRVSPGEIEEVVAELDGVAEVGAVGVPDELMGEVIRVVVVCQAGVELDAKAVQRHCHQQLPQYKIPKEVVFSDALPKTASGKIQRFALAADRQVVTANE